ncbi:MAG: hypothetical protein AAFX05_10035 [Planctomycetota bacterium]
METLLQRLFPASRSTWALHRNRVRWLVYGTLAYLGIWVLLVLYGWMHHWASFAMRMFAFIGTPAGVVYALGWVAMWRLDVRLRQKAADADWRLCCCCGYDLRGAPDAGTCPECGEAFSLSALRERWQMLGVQSPRGPAS